MSALRLNARRSTGRALSGLRSAPYLRKWLVLGAMIGVVAGVGAAVFYGGLHMFTHLLLTDLGGYAPARTAGEGGGFRAATGFSRPWAVPLVVAAGGVLAALLVSRFAPEAEGHGTDAAIRAVLTNPKGVRLRAMLVKFLASVITIGSGGSGGREGPTAQISSGFGSALARVLNLTPADSRIAVAAGIASGIAAIFRAPFGGALLGVELLYTDDMEIEALIPSLVAAVVGYGVFCVITGSYTPVFGDLAARSLRFQDLALFVPLGLLCGLAGRMYSRCFYLTADRFHAWRVPSLLKPAIGGLLVGAIGLAIPGVLGTGYGEVQAQLILHRLMSSPWLVVALLPAAKIVSTSLSIGSGGSGGIFGPGMVIGAATGALAFRFAHLLGLGDGYQLAFVIVGMAACFGAAAHAPLAILVMVVEMTGSLNMLPAAVVAVAFSLLVVGDTTIYRSQLRSRADSPAHRFDLRMGATALSAAEIMAPPRVVLDGALPAAEALARLRGAGVAGAPVVNADGAYLGNVQRRVLERGEASGAGAGQRAGAGGNVAVARLADPESITLPAEAGLEAVVEALPASAGGWVPVLDDEMRVRGIISATELSRGARRTMRSAVEGVLATVTSTAVVEGTLAQASPALERSIGELGLPAGTIILSATRSGAMRFPAAADQLHAGDRVTVLVAPAHAGEIRSLLGLEPDARESAASRDYAPPD